MLKRLLVFVAMLLHTGLLVGQNPLLRYPDLHPEGKAIAFAFQGDIWTMEIPEGTPRRLTVHAAYESHPMWARDGQQLAFVSDRFGNGDIFVMPATGGTATRLTYHDTNDMLGGWTAQNEVIFETNRSYKAVEWDQEIHTVSAAGGTPTRLLNAFGYMPKVSPSGRFVAFVQGACRVQREAYRGPAHKDIWLFDTQKQSYQRLTTDEGQDINPAWGKDDTELFFLSAKTGRYNVYRLTLGRDGKPNQDPQAITAFTDFGIRHLSAAAGKLLFERADKLYLMPDTGGQATPLAITIQTDQRFDNQTQKTFSADAEAYDIAPNGKLAAMEVHGEIFVKRNHKDHPRAVNRSEHPYRDRSVVWLNDSTILFVSDRSGNYELYLGRSSDPSQSDLFKTLKTDLQTLTKTAEDEGNPVVSPDGKKIAFTRGSGTLIVADISSEGALTNEKKLQEGWALPQGIAWSPDSKWLAYSFPDLDFNYEIYIHAADNSRPPVNVSMHPRRDSQPAWSRDGKKLAFVSSCNNGDDDIWFVWLQKADAQKTKRDWEESEQDQTNKADKKDKADQIPQVKIDFTDIHDRLVQVTSMSGEESEPVFSQDGQQIFFTSESNTQKERALYQIKWDGSQIKELAGGGPAALSLSRDGKSLYFVQKGKLSKLEIASSKTEAMPHQARMTIDHAHEMEQIFEEAWKTIRERFYDPQFHGRDWEALKKQYKPLAMNASTKKDFQDMFNLMLGQLNASHMGMYNGEPEAQLQRQRIGYLGIETIPAKNGREVIYVIPETPADKMDSKINIGETIVSIDGTALTQGVNLYQLLLDKVDEEILLEIADKKGKRREVVIRPVASIREEKYAAWVKEKRQLVDRYSNGKLGYIHIQGMNWPSFERFERELTASGSGKEGLVIDVRYNGGGWTTDYLMTVLTVRQHAYTIPRGAAQDLNAEHPRFAAHYPYGERLPFSAWTKPTVALCNPNSYSNAEIFSHAYKGLGLGKLIGKPTFGAVISTGGTRLLDGALLRLPFRAWYAKATQENMELGPAVPDIEVDDLPDGRAQNEDPQLQRAVEELLKK